MRATYSYESVLRAVGRALDEAGVTGIALRETDNGIAIEGIKKSDLAPASLSYDLRDLCEMIDQTEGSVEGLFEAAHASPEARTLREFLARREVVVSR